jgi:hypothetical protein
MTHPREQMTSRATAPGNDVWAYPLACGPGGRLSPGKPRTG